MRHLAIISEHASPIATLGGAEAGGQNEYVAQIAQRVAAHGYCVDVFTRREDPEAPEIVQWRPGVRLVHVQAGPARKISREDLLPYMSEFADRVIAFAKRERIRYDVTHANYWMSGLVAAIMKRALGVPFVVTFHSLSKVRRQFHSDADRFPVSRPIIEEQVISDADTIIAECPQDEQDLCTLYDAAPSRIAVIPCGVDTEHFRPLSAPYARKALGLSPQGDLLVTVGRLVPRKGTDDAIRALGVLKREHKLEPQLLIVGGEVVQAGEQETPEVVRLRRIARDETVEDQVTLVGPRGRDELGCYYSAADICLTTPWYEPFGMTPLESMACGTPVVGTRVGGIKHTVQHGTTGLLVPPHDPRAIATAVARLLRAPEERAAFAQAGLARARVAFSWTDIIARLVRTYQDAEARTPAPRAYASRAPRLPAMSAVAHAPANGNGNSHPPSGIPGDVLALQ